MITFFALVMGVLFGAGLYVAGMTNPAKFRAFWISVEPGIPA